MNSFFLHHDPMPTSRQDTRSLVICSLFTLVPCVLGGSVFDLSLIAEHLLVGRYWRTSLARLARILLFLLQLRPYMNLLEFFRPFHPTPSNCLPVYTNEGPAMTGVAAEQTNSQERDVTGHYKMLRFCWWQMTAASLSVATAQQATSTFFSHSQQIATCS
ncbi:hypothetical protein C8Q77DRAFT_1114124 [Trametes polyzona]|nr:hypothetical protein C8Q77DRAFT_1114124 [Trametes polyzona]